MYNVFKGKAKSDQDTLKQTQKTYMASLIGMGLGNFFLSEANFSVMQLKIVIQVRLKILSMAHRCQICNKKFTFFKINEMRKSGHRKMINVQFFYF